MVAVLWKYSNLLTALLDLHRFLRTSLQQYSGKEAVYNCDRVCMSERLKHALFIYGWISGDLLEYGVGSLADFLLQKIQEFNTK